MGSTVQHKIIVVKRKNILVYIIYCSFTPSSLMSLLKIPVLLLLTIFANCLAIFSQNVCPEIATPGSTRFHMQQISLKEQCIFRSQHQMIALLCILFVVRKWKIGWLQTWRKRWTSFEALWVLNRERARSVAWIIQGNFLGFILEPDRLASCWSPLFSDRTQERG